jgi:hypothetical protein
VRPASLFPVVRGVGGSEQRHAVEGERRVDEPVRHDGGLQRRNCAVERDEIEERLGDREVRLRFWKVLKGVADGEGDLGTVPEATPRRRRGRVVAMLTEEPRGEVARERNDPCVGVHAVVPCGRVVPLVEGCDGEAGPRAGLDDGWAGRERRTQPVPDAAIARPVVDAPFRGEIAAARVVVAVAHATRGRVRDSPTRGRPPTCGR